VSDRLLGAARLRAVAGDLLRLARHALGESLLERVRNAPVQFPALAREQRLVRRVLDQRVFEGVGRPGRKAPLVDELRLHQPPEPLAQRCLLDGRHRLQQRVGELAPDRRAHLRHGLRLTQPVEPRHQRVLECLRNLQARERAGEVVPRLDHLLRQLLHEERDAVGARRDLANQRFGQRPPRDRLDGQGARFLALESIQGDGLQMCVARPRRLEVGSVRQQKQHARRGALLDQQPQPL
jgi:hypothetical protein